MAEHPNGHRGYTPREVSKLLRVSPDRVRAMIVRGELGAVNTAPAHSPRPRYVVLPHHLVEFEKRHAATTPPVRSRRKPRLAVIDFFPN
jgi:hypothetical protein